jgi:hypothetical protein
VTLEVLKHSVAHEVAVLAVLKRAVGSAGAIKGVVLHGNNVHDGGSEVPQECPRVFIPACATKQPQAGKQEKSGDLVVNPMIGTELVVT